MNPDNLQFDDLMCSSYEEYGLDGSPVRFPAFVRRVVAWVISFHPRLFAAAVWWFHRVWGFFGQRLQHPMARSWAEFASQYRYEDALGLARAVCALDRYPTFRSGCRALGFRNCLEAMFYRGAFLDPFFKQGRWSRTKFTHPFQQPQYFIPGIPSQRFYDARRFEWADPLEQNCAEIREELLGLLNVHRDEFGAITTEFDNSIPGWNTFNFYVNGRRQEENCALAPCTARIAHELLKYEEGELTMFSALNPHSRIPPHVGPLNGILRCHLPLLAPAECGLRVGGETVHWEEGRILIFDDSFVHEVWNHSDAIRIVLFFNVWHPSLSIAERRALAELRRSYHDTPVGRHWTKQQESQRPSTMLVNH